MKYDYKVNLQDGRPVDDVGGVFINNVFNGKNNTLDIGVIKLGDWKANDEYFIDITYTKKWEQMSWLLDIGRGIKSDELPRDYFISRFSHPLFTLEGGSLSEHGYSNLREFFKDKYYWAAIHPKYMFLAAGNEVDRTWMLAGTKDMESFGTFACGDYDRDNGNYWFRWQTGYGSVNQKYYCLDNYLIASSYLVVPPFFYKHFGPISTKGDYGFKVDAIKSNGVEKFEYYVSKKFGAYGYWALGWQREVPNRNGFIIEAYKELTMKNLKLIVEGKYESNYGRFSGFIVTSYEF